MMACSCTTDWVAIAACAFLVFVLGMAFGAWLLRAVLRHDGIIFHWRVDEKQER